MKFLSFYPKKLKVDLSLIKTSNEFYIIHEKGKVKCLEYGDHTEETILLFSPKGPEKKILNLIDDFLENRKHVMLVIFKNSADILAAFFRIKTSYRISIYSFRDMNDITHNTLKYINEACIGFKPKFNFSIEEKLILIGS